MDDGCESIRKKIKKAEKSNFKLHSFTFIYCAQFSSELVFQSTAARSHGSWRRTRMNARKWREMIGQGELSFSSEEIQFSTCSSAVFQQTAKLAWNFYVTTFLQKWKIFYELRSTVHRNVTFLCGVDEYVWRQLRLTLHWSQLSSTEKFRWQILNFLVNIKYRVCELSRSFRLSWLQGAEGNFTFQKTHIVNLTRAC